MIPSLKSSLKFGSILVRTVDLHGTLGSRRLDTKALPLHNKIYVLKHLLLEPWFPVTRNIPLLLPPRHVEPASS